MSELTPQNLINLQSNPYSIQDAAGRLYRSFEQKLQVDGTLVVWLQNSAPGWMFKAVSAVRREIPTEGDVTFWQTLKRCAAALSDSVPDNEGDAIHDIPTASHPKDIVSWLLECADCHSYIVQADNDFGGFEDAVALIQAAQRCQIDAIGWSLLEALRKEVDAFKLADGQTPITLTELQEEMLIFCADDNGLEAWYVDHFKPNSRQAVMDLVRLGLVYLDGSKRAYFKTSDALPYIERIRAAK